MARIDLGGMIVSAVVAFVAACGSGPVAPLQTAVPGVVFTYPADQQLDVPLGTRIVVTFSDPVDASTLGPCTGQGSAVTGAFCLVGPAGPVDATAMVSGDTGNSVQFTAAALEPGTSYGVYVGAALAPTAKNLPASGPLFSFTTRTSRPRAAAPTLVAVNGADPAGLPDAQHPMFETTTIELLFSEPLDPRTVALAPGSVQLFDRASGAAVPATVFTDGIHVAIDPTHDLTAGATYDVQLGAQLADLGGTPFAATMFSVVPLGSRGSGAIPQVLRTRQPGDPGPLSSRSGATRNVIEIDKPLIGTASVTVQPSVIASELGDPTALGGPIAFTIRRGQRIATTGIDVKLGGTIPGGLSTGDITIEFLTDVTDRLYRNPHQAADQRPENDRAPLYVDLTFDVGVFTTDPAGNAVLTQTVLGVQASGTVIATDGVLAIEAVSSMELGLLGVTAAPANLVLELITDPSASVLPDHTAPKVVATFPADGAADQPVAAGIDVIFSEPIDLDRARAGGVALADGTGKAVDSVIESHGASIVIRPVAPLAYSAGYHVTLADVADVAGNALAGGGSFGFSTPTLVGTSVPMTVVGVRPGVPCALTGGTASSPGRCAAGAAGDELYAPFSLAANEDIAVELSQPPRAASIVHGTFCNGGSVRIEQLDASGACVAPVAGTLVHHDRSLAFTPDQPWVTGTHYRLTLVSGNNTSCDVSELCGIGADAASFDPLAGTQSAAAGGPDLVIDFVGGDADPAVTSLVTAATPFTDVNGSGFVEGGEVLRDNNRAALRITGTSGIISDASFNMTDCLPATPEVEGCMYLSGAMPAEIGALATNCPLPDGTTAPSCMPVTLPAQAMYATSLAMTATAIISINTDTGTSIMRIREPTTGPVTGYIIDNGGTPEMVVALDLYMDAPDMSILLSSDDLHSKPLSISLAGPLTYLPDGRIAIQLSNVADVPVTVNISTPLGDGAVSMILPLGEMKLQLVSPPIRGVER